MDDRLLIYRCFTKLHIYYSSQTLHCYSGRFEKELAAEALRKNENDTQKALDDLTNPETNSDLQVKTCLNRILCNFKQYYNLL